jgi:SAM-dependent methyltransferase
VARALLPHPFVSLAETAARMDAINRRAWSTSETIDWFSTLEGWTDPGERAAIESVAEQAADLPILDLGVGGGRTVPLLSGISDDYTGIDYTPELARACQSKYPWARIEIGDARDLSRFSAGAFALVVFSFNGIDAVGPEDRIVILREVHRVLHPGGVFVFSTHNQHGPGHGERLNLGVYRTRNPLRWAARALRAAAHVGETLVNRRRYARLNVKAGDVSLMNASAHHHGLVVHYTTLAHQLQELRDVGFAPDVRVFGNVDAHPVMEGEDTSQIWWFHLVAHK